MYIALAQAAEQGSYLSMGLFLVGIVALLYLLWRTMQARSRRGRVTSGAGFSRDGNRTAKIIISQIDSNNWVKQNRRAMKISRNAVSLNLEEKEFLQRIDDWQVEHRSRGTDG